MCSKSKNFVLLYHLVRIIMNEININKVNNDIKLMIIISIDVLLIFENEMLS